MSLTKADKTRYDRLFLDVGFEGQRLQDPANYIPDELKANDNIQDAPITEHSPTEAATDIGSASDISDSQPEAAEELDDDIMALLNDSSDVIANSTNGKADESSNDTDSIDEFDIGEDNDFDAFLDDSPKKPETPSDDTKAKPSTAVSRRIKEKKVEEKIVPIPNNTLPKELLFNLTLTEERLIDIANHVAELDTPKDSGDAYLEDKSKMSARLASRTAKPKEEVAVAENNTLPKEIIFNVNLSEDRLQQIFNSIGEIGTAAKKAESTYLEEEKSKLSSRIASRLKQKEEAVVPVENNIIPDETKLRFNFSVPDEHFEELARNIGNIVAIKKSSNPGAAFLEEAEKKSRIRSQKKEVKEIIADNPTLPGELRFNFHIDAKKLQHIIRNIGE